MRQKREDRKEKRETRREQGNANVFTSRTLTV